MTGEFRGLTASSEKNLSPIEAGLFLNSRLRGGWSRVPRRTVAFHKYNYVFIKPMITSLNSDGGLFTVMPTILGEHCIQIF